MPSFQNASLHGLIAVAFLLLAAFPIPQANAADVNLTLYGTMAGWGFTTDTITSPGPTIIVDPGDRVSASLVSVDGVPHIFGVDYNGNRVPDTGEPLSDPFNSTISYTFTVTAVPGAYNYYCYYHSTTQWGAFIVRGNQPPKASFIFLPSSPVQGQQVFFDASSSYDVDGTIVDYAWDFGDGSVGYLSTVNHAYNSVGDFTVTLNVTDDQGYSASTQKSVTVSPPPFINSPPTANFTVTPSAPRVGQLLVFNGSASHDDDPGDRISLYKWNFGDGTINRTLLSTISHRYSLEGVFTVTLAVNDSLTPQLQDTVQMTIIVGSPIRDVAIMRAFAPQSAYRRDIVTITVEVKNKGTIEENCSISLLRDTSIVATKTIIGLEPDAVNSTTFYWDTAGISPGQHLLTLTVNPMPGEASVEDNTSSLTISILERESPQPSLYPLILALPLAAIIMTVVFYILKKRRGATL